MTSDELGIRTGFRCDGAVGIWCPVQGDVLIGQPVASLYNDGVSCLAHFGLEILKQDTTYLISLVSDEFEVPGAFDIEIPKYDAVDPADIDTWLGNNLHGAAAEGSAESVEHDAGYVHVSFIISAQISCRIIGKYTVVSRGDDILEDSIPDSVIGWTPKADSLAL